MATTNIVELNGTTYDSLATAIGAAQNNDILKGNQISDVSDDLNLEIYKNLNFLGTSGVSGESTFAVQSSASANFGSTDSSDTNYSFNKITIASVDATTGAAGGTVNVNNAILQANTVENNGTFIVTGTSTLKGDGIVTVTIPGYFSNSLRSYTAKLENAAGEALADYERSFDVAAQAASGTFDLGMSIIPDGYSYKIYASDGTLVSDANISYSSMSVGEIQLQGGTLHASQLSEDSTIDVYGDSELKGSNSVGTISIGYYNETAADGSLNILGSFYGSNIYVGVDEGSSSDYLTKKYSLTIGSSETASPTSLYLGGLYTRSNTTTTMTNVTGSIGNINAKGDITIIDSKLNLSDSISIERKAVSTDTETTNKQNLVTVSGSTVSAASLSLGTSSRYGKLLVNDNSIVQIGGAATVNSGSDIVIEGNAVFAVSGIVTNGGSISVNNAILQAAEVATNGITVTGTSILKGNGIVTVKDLIYSAYETKTYIAKLENAAGEALADYERSFAVAAQSTSGTFDLGMSIIPDGYSYKIYTSDGTLVSDAKISYSLMSVGEIQLQGGTLHSSLLSEGSTIDVYGVSELKGSNSVGTISIGYFNETAADGSLNILGSFYGSNIYVGVDEGSTADYLAKKYSLTIGSSETASPTSVYFGTLYTRSNSKTTMTNVKGTIGEINAKGDITITNSNLTISQAVSIERKTVSTDTETTNKQNLVTVSGSTVSATSLSLGTSSRYGKLFVKDNSDVKISTSATVNAKSEIEVNGGTFSVDTVTNNGTFIVSDDTDSTTTPVISTLKGTNSNVRVLVSKGTTARTLYAKLVDENGNVHSDASYQQTLTFAANVTSAFFNLGSLTIPEGYSYKLYTDDAMTAEVAGSNFLYDFMNVTGNAVQLNGGTLSADTKVMGSVDVNGTAAIQGGTFGTVNVGMSSTADASLNITGDMHLYDDMWIGNDDGTFTDSGATQAHKVIVDGGTVTHVSKDSSLIYIAQSGYLLIENGGTFSSDTYLNFHGYIDVTGTGSTLNGGGLRLNGETGKRAQLNVSAGAKFVCEGPFFNIGHETAQNRSAEVNVTDAVLKTGNMTVYRDSALTVSTTDSLENTPVANVSAGTVTNNGTISVTSGTFQAKAVDGRILVNLSNITPVASVRTGTIYFYDAQNTVIGSQDISIAANAETASIFLDTLFDKNAYSQCVLYIGGAEAKGVTFESISGSVTIADSLLETDKYTNGGTLAVTGTSTLKGKDTTDTEGNVVKNALALTGNAVQLQGGTLTSDTNMSGAINVYGSSVIQGGTVGTVQVGWTDYTTDNASLSITNDLVTTGYMWTGNDDTNSDASINGSKYLLTIGNTAKRLSIKTTNFYVRNTGAAQISNADVNATYLYVTNYLELNNTDMTNSGEMMIRKKVVEGGTVDAPAKIVMTKSSLKSGNLYLGDADTSGATRYGDFILNESAFTVTTKGGNITVYDGSKIELSNKSTLTASKIDVKTTVNESGEVTVSDSTLMVDAYTNGGTLKVSGTSTLKGIDTTDTEGNVVKNALALTGNAVQLQGGTLTSDTNMSGAINVYGSSVIQGGTVGAINIGNVSASDYKNSYTDKADLTITGTTTLTQSLFVGWDETTTKTADQYTNYKLTLDHADFTSTTNSFYVRNNGSMEIKGGTSNLAYFYVTNYVEINSGANVTIHNEAGTGYFYIVKKSSLGGSAEMPADVVVKEASNLTVDILSLTLKDSSRYGRFTVTGNSTVTANILETDALGAIKIAAGSVINVKAAFTNSGSISIDMTEAASQGVYKLMDFTGTTGTVNYGTLVSGGTVGAGEYGFIGTVPEGYALTVIDNDLFAANVDMTTIKVDASYSTKEAGAEVAEGFFYGFNAFSSFSKAVAAANTAVTTGGSVNIELASGTVDASGINISNALVLSGNGSLDLNGSNLTIGYSTADGSLTITEGSVIDLINGNGQGLIVSGAKTGRFNGTLKIQNATVTTGYFLNRNIVEITGNSSATAIPSTDAAPNLTTAALLIYSRSVENANDVVATVEVSSNGYLKTTGKKEYTVIGKAEEGRGKLTIDSSRYEDDSPTITVATIGELELKNNSVMVASGTIKNAGTVSLADSEMSAKVFENTGTFTITGASTLKGVDTNALLLTGNAVQLKGGTTQTDAVSLTDSNVSGTGIFNVYGIAAVGGTTNLAGTINIGYSGYTTDAASMSVSGDFTMTGKFYVGDDAKRVDSDGNVIPASTTAPYQLLVGENTARTKFNATDSFYVRNNGTMNIVNSDATFGKDLLVSNYFEIDNSSVAVSSSLMIYKKGANDGELEGSSENPALVVLKGGGTLTVSSVTELGYGIGRDRYGALEIKDKSTFNGSSLILYHSGTSVSVNDSTTNLSGALKNTDGDLLLTGGTVTAASVANTGSIAMDYKSAISFSGDFSNTGTITIDMTGAASKGVYRLMNFTGTTGTVDYGTYSFTGTVPEGYALTVIGNDLFAANVDMTTLTVDASYSTKEFGEEVADGFFYGFNAFSTLGNAFAKATSATKTISVTSDLTETLAGETLFTVTDGMTVSGAHTLNFEGEKTLRFVKASDAETIPTITLSGTAITNNGYTGIVYIGNYTKSESGTEYYPTYSTHMILSDNASINVGILNVSVNSSLTVNAGSQVSSMHESFIVCGTLTVNGSADFDPAKASQYQLFANSLKTSPRAGSTINKPSIQFENTYAGFYGQFVVAENGGSVSLSNTLLEGGKGTYSIESGMTNTDTWYFNPTKNGVGILTVNAGGEFSATSSTIRIANTLTNKGTFSLMDSKIETYADIVNSGTLTIKNSSVAAGAYISSDITVAATATSVTNTGSIAMDYKSAISFSGDFSNTGTITIDMTGAASKGIYKLMDFTGTTGTVDYGTYSFITGTVPEGYALTVIGNDLFAANVDMTTIKVDASYSTYEIGDKVSEGYFYGFNAFSTIEKVATALPADTTTVEIAGGSYDRIQNDSTWGLVFSKGGTFTVADGGTASFASTTTTEGTTFGNASTQANFILNGNWKFDKNVYTTFKTDLTLNGTLDVEKTFAVWEQGGHVTVAENGLLTTTTGGGQMWIYGSMTVNGKVKFDTGSQDYNLYIGKEDPTANGQTWNEGEGVLTVSGANASVDLGVADGMALNKGAKVGPKGILIVENGASFKTAKTLYNTGTVKVTGASLVSEGLDNSSEFTIANSTLTVSGDIVNTGSITLDYLSTIAFSGGFTNNGTFTVSTDGWTSGTYKLMDYTGSATLADSFYQGLLGSNWDSTHFLVQNNDLYYTDITDGFTVYVNSSYSATGTNDNHIWGVDAFASFDDAKNVNPSKIVATGDEKHTEQVYGGTVSEKGEKNWNFIAGGATLQIDSGTFSNRPTCGGDRVENGNVERTGDVNMTITGGTFNTTVGGGMYYFGNYTDGGSRRDSVYLAGNINLTISGGTFNRIYGGNVSRISQYSGLTTVGGDINLVLDASVSLIKVNEHIVAGSSGTGYVEGNVSVTIKGSGTNLDFSNILCGGSYDTYYYTNEAGKRDCETYVTGTTSLDFNGFTGDFKGDIEAFQKITFTGSSNVNFTNAKLDLSYVSDWNFDSESSLSGLLANNFAGDTLNFDLSSWNNKSTEKTVASGSAAAFTGWDDSTTTKVKFGDLTASWNAGLSAWCSAEAGAKLYLSVDEDKTKLMIAAYQA